MVAQAAAFPVKLASPSTIRLLTELAQTGEIPYELSPSDTEDAEVDDISDECLEGEHDECDDALCECECHENDDEGDISEDEFDDEDFESDESDEDDSEDPDEDSDILSDED